MEETKRKLFKNGWIAAFCLRYAKWPLLLLVLVTLAESAILFGTSVLFGLLVGEFQGMHEVGGMTGLFALLAISYVALLLFGDLLHSGLNSVYAYAHGKIDSSVSGLIFLKAYEADHVKFFQKDYLDLNKFMYEHYGEIVGSLESAISTVFGSISVIMGSVAVFIFTEPLMIFYLLAVVLIRGGTAFYFSKKQYDILKNSIMKHMRREEYYRELMSNKKYGKEIRVYRLLPFLQTKWKQFYTIIWNLRRKNNLKERNYSSIAGIIVTILDYSVVLLLVYSVYLGNISLAVFTILFSLSRTSSAQVGSIAENLSRSIFQGTTYMGDLQKFMHPIRKGEMEKLGSSQDMSDILPFGGFESLRAEHITFTYPEGGRPAVEDVCFELKKGEIVSILGYNGSGKTTLSKLLTGLMRPDVGTVTLNGETLSPDNRDEMYKYFGVAYQDFMPYLMTLRENVGFGRIEHLNDRIMLDEAYEKGNLERILSKLDKGENTPIGKAFWTDTADLSGGEWQRVILGRAHMGNPEVLILDEPTASIDPLEELRMLDNLRRYVAGRTAILISHRIGFARLADRIVMMDGGKITEIGSHEDLLQKNGYYAKLFFSQKELYEEQEEEISDEK